jgi:hypothetical protein
MADDKHRTEDRCPLLTPEASFSSASRRPNMIVARDGSREDEERDTGANLVGPVMVEIDGKFYFAESARGQGYDESRIGSRSEDYAPDDDFVDTMFAESAPRRLRYEGLAPPLGAKAEPMRRSSKCHSETSMTELRRLRWRDETAVEKCGARDYEDTTVRQRSAPQWKYETTLTRSTPTVIAGLNPDVRDECQQSQGAAAERQMTRDVAPSYAKPRLPTGARKIDTDAMPRDGANEEPRLITPFNLTHTAPDSPEGAAARKADSRVSRTHARRDSRGNWEPQWEPGELTVSGDLEHPIHNEHCPRKYGDDQECRPYDSPRRTQSPYSRRTDTALNVVRHTVMKPDKFDVERIPLNTFLIQFETCCKYNGWSDRERAAHLKCCLAGEAAQILWDCHDVDCLTCDQLVEKLKTRFGTAGQKEKFMAELRARRRKRNESLPEMYHDIRRLMALAYPEHGGSELLETIGRDHFIRTLDDVDLEIKIRDKELADLDAAFKTALRIEACLKNLDAEDLTPRPRKNRDEERVSRQVTSGDPDTKSRIQELQSQVSDLRRQSDDLRRQRDEYNNELARLKCIHPHHTNILASGTLDTYTERLPSAPAAKRPEQRRKSAPKCYNCSRMGHIARSCTERLSRPPAAASEPEGVNTAQLIQNVTGQQNDPNSYGTYLRCRVNHEYRKCLLDTGSEVFLISVGMTNGLTLEPTEQKLFAANGTPIEVLGRVSAPMYLGSKRLSIDALVT